jgi:UDP-2-acetamido-3-amino-2,3-dideoxy-glucuronate N-acetyltransferase
MNQHIAETVKLGNNVKLGFNVVICDNVTIGDDCTLGHNVVIHPCTQIGKNVRIDDNTIIGKRPLSSPRSIFKPQAELQPAVIGDFCQIGANVIIYAQCTIGEKNLIADLATLRENVTIGELNIIGRNATIENFVKVGNRNKFETNCYITAYSEIEDYCFVAPCVATSNDNYMGRDIERFNHFKGVTIKTGGRIGVNSTVLPGKTINKDGMVAAASVVTRDVQAATVVLGSPARTVGEVVEPQLLKNNRDK